MYPTISPPWLQFSQTRPNFFKNHEMNPINLWNLKKFINLEARGLENTFGPLEARRCIQPKVQNPSSNFTNKGSFSQKSWDESNKIMKHQKTYWPCCLEPRNYIWAAWTQKTCWTIHKSRTLAPIFTSKASFSQESWDEFNKIMLSEKISGPLGLAPRNYLLSHKSNFNSNFHKQNLFFSRIFNSLSFFNQPWFSLP